MKTLYERIGGDPSIEKLVGSFYHTVLADPELKHFFENVSIEKLKRMQKAFFSIALGGPDPGVKISLYEAHRGRGIERKHLTRFTEHLMDTLTEIGIEDQSAQEVYRRIGTYSNDILGDATVDG